jgi:hypothetical protein
MKGIFLFKISAKASTMTQFKPFRDHVCVCVFFVFVFFMFVCVFVCFLCLCVCLFLCACACACSCACACACSCACVCARGHTSSDEINVTFINSSNAGSETLSIVYSSQQMDVRSAQNMRWHAEPRNPAILHD